MCDILWRNWKERAVMKNFLFRIRYFLVPLNPNGRIFISFLSRMCYISAGLDELALLG